jgi:uncharacterized protein YeaO (DUF488 family)
VPVRVVQLGTRRMPGEGARLGTVRRPPRGVTKDQYASLNYFDVWFPNLAPSAELIAWMRSKPLTERRWRAFARRYRAEMSKPDNSRVLDVISVLSHQTNFSVGCYCESEDHCHRSLLRDLLVEHGANLA